MTALHLDGFDHYGVGNPSLTNMAAGNYLNANNVPCSATTTWGGLPRTGTGCLIQNGLSPSGFGYALASPTGHIFQSFGFAVSHLNNGSFRVCNFCTSGGALLGALWYTTNGSLQLRGSDDTTVLGTTSGPVIVAENWHFFEMEWNSGSTQFNLRVDDASAANTPILSVTNGAITGTVGILNYMGSADGAANLDDLFIRDASGATNNSWLGDRRIATLFANGDTATAGWTPNFYKQLGAGILDNTATGSQNSAAWAAGISAQNVGSGDFTIEGFVRFQALPTGSNKATIFSKWDETDNLREYQLFLGGPSLNNSSLCFQTSTDGTISTVQQPIVYPWAPALDTWYHIAVVRASSQDLLFVNGQQLGLPIADSRTYFAATAATFSTGAQVENHTNPVIANTNLQGWFDEVRLTVGFARYTTNFTPTTVEFGRNVDSDPQFADVAFLAGYDSTIQDESSHLTTMGASGAVQKTVADGGSIGSFTTLGTTKVTPDDNTFMSAPFVAATGILTASANPANNNTVTVGTKDGSTPAVYTFKATLTGAAFEVLVDTNTQNSLQNLFNAINAGPGAGTKYGTGTTSNFNVSASQLPAGQMQVTSLTAGTAGNSIASTVGGGFSGSWGGTTLSGGLNIPGPSAFTVQRLPPNTTLISAIQLCVRAFKSDSGLGSINSAFIGALGGTTVGSAHNLAISPSYYNDVYQTDPDTSGPISPTTITNGKIEINRDT